MNKLKVMTILGTRPEIIRLSEIIKKLDKYTNHILVHTQQSFDYNLSQVFFDGLKIRKPDYLLDVKSNTMGAQIGKILSQTEVVLLETKPDAVLILGDTNSALSCIIAKRMHIPIFHMEAGNRCFDDRVPEEVNRRIVDHTADINLCYTEHARRNLLAEGLNTRDIFVTGSPLPEVYSVHSSSIAKSRVLVELNLEPDKYLLASIHREENVETGNLGLILEAFDQLILEYGIPVVFPAHPRVRAKLGTYSYTRPVTIYEPFGMFDYIKLQQNAFCNLSDSGTIHEDAAILNIPAVNIRESQERPEAYDAGSVVISGVAPKGILDAVRLVRGQLKTGAIFSSPYGEDVNHSDKTVRLILGLTHIIKERNQ